MGIGTTHIVLTASSILKLTVAVVILILVAGSEAHMPWFRAGVLLALWLVGFAGMGKRDRSGASRLVPQVDGDVGKRRVRRRSDWNGSKDGIGDWEGGTGDAVSDRRGVGPEWTPPGRGSSRLLAEPRCRHSALRRDQREQSAFIRQGQTVARISSKFVVDIYDCGTYEDGPFVVFERPANTLAGVIGAGGEIRISWVGLAGTARELEEAYGCLQLAGVEFGSLRPEIVGITKAGHVRLSPWPLCGAAVPAPVTGHTLSSEDLILALLAAAAGSSTQDSTAVRCLLERRSETIYPPAQLRAWAAGRPDRVPAETPSDPATATAQVLVGPDRLSRPTITSHTMKRHRPRYRYVAAAGVAVVAIATLGGVISLIAQGGAPGLKDRGLPRRRQHRGPGRRH